MNPYPREGQLWAHFEIRSEIARGNMGVVYRALDTRTGREVALKILVGGHDNPDAVERFKREAKSLARLSHPNIVNVHSYGVQLGLPFLTMDYVPGTTLQELLSRGALPLPRAVDLLARIAKGLDHVHSRGVLHRDVKPANVLIGPDGQPRITDFGLAKLADASISLTQDGDIIGTPVYMSPEQIQGQQRLVGPSTDVWALGVVLYLMLTNELPFRGRTVDQVSQAVVQQEPPAPRELVPGVPDDLERVCLTALAKDPRRRYQSAGELARDLEAYLRGGEVLAGTVNAAVRLRRAGRFVQLHAVAVGALSVSLLLLVGVGGLHLFLESRSRRAASEQREKELSALRALTGEAVTKGVSALAELRPKQALARAEAALEELARAPEDAAREVAGQRAELERLRARARIQLGTPEAAEQARAFGRSFVERGALEDAEDYLAHAWFRPERDDALLRDGAARLPALAALDGPDAARWLQVCVRWRELLGEDRPWRELLDRSSGLRDAARLLEAEWLLDRERLEEARAQLNAADPGGELAPLVHARYVRALRRHDLSVRSVNVAGAVDWLDVHEHLLRAAASGGPRDRIAAAAGAAEAALLAGEPRRAATLARAAYAGLELPAELEAPLRLIELRATVLLQGDAAALRALRDLPRLAPRDRVELASLCAACGLSPEAPYPPGPAAACQELVDRSARQVEESVGLLALDHLELSHPPAGAGGDLTRLRAAAQAFVHPALTAAWALRELTQRAPADGVRDSLLAGRQYEQPWLLHPTFSLTRRLTNSRPFERLLVTPAPAPPGYAEGRAWLVRYATTAPGGEAADLAWQRARAALGVAARCGPAHPGVRLARARLYLLRAARGDQDAPALALREAAAALLCAPELPAARELLAEATWVQHGPEVLTRLLGLHERWRLEGEPALPAGALPLLRALEQDPPALDGQGHFLDLTLAARRLHELQAARDPARELAPSEVTIALREKLAAAESGGLDEERLWLEGQLLLEDPRRIEEQLLDEVPRLDPRLLPRVRREAGRSPEPGHAEPPPGPYAAAARALLLCEHLRGSSRGPRAWREGRELLEELWRDRPGPSCFALQAALVLLTRAPERALLGDLWGGPADWKGDLAAVVEALGRPRPQAAPSGGVARLLEHPGIKPWAAVCWK
ncbi:MAG: protein kinase [Planctomycetota bacterium]